MPTLQTNSEKTGGLLTKKQVLKWTELLCTSGKTPNMQHRNRSPVQPSVKQALHSSPAGMTRFYLSMLNSAQQDTLVRQGLFNFALFSLTKELSFCRQWRGREVADLTRPLAFPVSFHY